MFIFLFEKGPLNIAYNDPQICLVVLIYFPSFGILYIDSLINCGTFNCKP